jgi:NAD(P)-dependent dehydrogenase (short-subunit alcohol dehydrogenase family)
LADVNESRLAEAAAEVESAGRRALPVACDVSSDEAVEALAKSTIDAMGRVDVVMNNAGVAIRGPVDEISMDDWRWIVDINLLGVVRGTRAFLPHLLAQKSGWIVNTASVAGLTGSPVGVPYATTKQAVVGFSESVALYTRPRGIGVSVLCPGGVATNIAENLKKVGTNERYWAGIDQLGAGQVTPEAVAGILLDGIDAGAFVITTGPLSPTMKARADALETNAGARLDKGPDK